MSLIPQVGRKKLSIRLFILIIYTMLIIMGSTMLIPFAITLSSSTTNNYDYQRYRPVPRYFWSTTDRFMKGLVYYFNNFRSWNDEMRSYLPEAPSHWTSWSTIGRDIEKVDEIAQKYLDKLKKKPKTERIVAADYSRFCDQLPLSETTVCVITPQAINFMQEYYTKLLKKENPQLYKSLYGKALNNAALKLLSEKWGLPYESFFNVNFVYEVKCPLDFQQWYPPLSSPKYQDFLRLKNAYRAQIFTPGVRSKWLNYLNEKKYEYSRAKDIFPVTEFNDKKLHKLWGDFKALNAPAAPTIPYALRIAWYKYLANDEVAKMLKLKDGNTLNIEFYNKLAKSEYENIQATPFPIPVSFPPSIQKLWKHYVETRFPLRLTKFKLNNKIQKDFQLFLKKEIKHIRIANQLLGFDHKSWDQFKLSATAPMGEDSDLLINRRNVWQNFVKRLPMNMRKITSSEMNYQKFILKKYGSLKAINETYAWKLKHLEEAFPPFMSAYTITFTNNETAFTLTPILYNYKIIFEYLILNANAVPVTLMLIALTIFCSLTINPIAAYAMSRFNLKGQNLIILFMLSTMAFPAMVSAIPGYLLMRDLGLLNTFFALVLPGAANGMAIFILKGFFDTLPQELYEAATIDGASEFQIFRIVAMPLVKPILAINCLGAFISAYNGWQWALIICQDKKMWTIAVWMYQASMWWGDMPWIVTAGFIITSIPTFLVFISCQKIILRGIIVPSMK